MRYTVHTHRTFHHRITKYLGVLVGAALIATLGLPSVAQAQANDVTVTYADGPGFMVTWTASSRFTEISAWIVTFTNPAGVKVTETTTSIEPVMLDENDLGTWWFQVDACFKDLAGDNTPPDECPTGELGEGESVGYTHGAFPAPENLAASLIPDGVYLSWTAVKDDLGLVGYQYSTDGEKWAGASAGSQIVDAMPGDQTFWVRAQGHSDNDLNTADGMVPGEADSVEVTVPMPAPTLPEIAALFLAMLLLGSGAYLLRRRQSGGLTPA